MCVCVCPWLTGLVSCGIWNFWGLINAKSHSWICRYPTFDPPYTSGKRALTGFTCFSWSGKQRPLNSIQCQLQLTEGPHHDLTNWREPLTKGQTLCKELKDFDLSGPQRRWLISGKLTMHLDLLFYYVFLLWCFCPKINVLQSVKAVGSLRGIQRR